MLMVPQRDTSLDEIKTIEDPYERLQFAIEHEVVIKRKYYNVAFLQNVDPGPQIFDQASACPELGVGEEEGIIVNYLAIFRGVVGRHMGIEISSEQANDIELADDRVRIPRFHVYDVRITDAVRTDGPELREELLASFENEMKNRKKERTSQMVMAESLAKLTDFLAKGEADEADLIEQIVSKKLMTPEQLRELAAAMEAPETEEAGKGKKRGAK